MQASSTRRERGVVKERMQGVPPFFVLGSVESEAPGSDGCSMQRAWLAVSACWALVCVQYSKQQVGSFRAIPLVV